MKFSRFASGSHSVCKLAALAAWIVFGSLLPVSAGQQPADSTPAPAVGQRLSTNVILSEAKNPAINDINHPRDSSSPSAPQNDGLTDSHNRFSPAPALSETHDAARKQVVARYGKLPLSFEANRGQTDPQVRFLARGGGYTLFLTGDGVVLALRQPETRKPGRNPKLESGKSKLGVRHLSLTTHHSPAVAESVVRMRLIGANARAAVTGLAELPGKSNYFIGNDPKKWRTDVPNYAKVRYQNAYPGIDLVYYGNQGQLEYDFVVAPGADPAAIRLDVAPASSRHAAPSLGSGQALMGGSTGARQAAPLRVDRNGDLVMRLNGGEIRFHKPVVYQNVTAGLSGRAAVGAIHESPPHGHGAQQAAPLRRYLDGHYVLKAHNQVGFEVGSYNRSQPLTIDPVLTYSSYIGGSRTDLGYGIAVDGSGNAYLTGYTQSYDFPVVNQIPGACNGSCGSGNSNNVFVTKINAAGNALVYSSYIGGSSQDEGHSIAVDSSGNAFLTGETDSTDFPRVHQIPGACNGSCGSGFLPVAFVTKVNAVGSALVYSSLIGGSGGENLLGAGSIALDGSGNTYLTGYTGSADFPRLNQIPGACNGSCGNGSAVNVFVTKVNAAGSALVYSSLIGGSDTDEGYGIAVDGSGNAYLTGASDSADFPRMHQIPGACNGSCGSGYPFPVPFVTKINAAGSALVYSSLIGGSDGSFFPGEDGGITVDGSGNAYLTGGTNSTGFPQVNQIPGACNGSCGSGPLPVAFVTKVNAAGSALVYSSLIGGSGNFNFDEGDSGNGIAIDGSGNAYLMGYTGSTDFPIVNQIPGACNGSCGTSSSPPAFVTEINAAGSALVYSSFLGGSGGDAGFGIAVDASANAYLAGITNSIDFPRLNQIPGACNGGCGKTNTDGDAFVTKITPAGTPIVSLSPTSLSFGPQGVQAPNFPQIVTLTNTGQLPLAITSIAITGQNTGDFLEADNCPRSPNTLAPGDNCAITVVFAPTGAGTLNADITVTDNAPDSPQNVPLTGLGVNGRPGLAKPQRRP